MRLGSVVMAAATGRQGGGERTGGGGGGGGGAEGTLMLKNHSANTFIGWVSGTVPNLETDEVQIGWLTNGTNIVGFGRNVGMKWRTAHVLVPAPGIAAGGTLSLDLATLTVTTPPASGNLADVPAVGGVPLVLQSTTPDGPNKIYRYQAKLDTWFTATVWIHYSHGQNVHRVAMLITNSNNSNAVMQPRASPSLVLTCGAATVTWTGTVPPFVAGVAAADTLTANAVNDGDFLIVNHRIYYWKDTLSGSNQVKRDAVLATSLANLRKAINLTGVAGVDYSADMTVNEWVSSPASGALTVSLQSLVANEGGNWIGTSVGPDNPHPRLSVLGMGGGQGFAFGLDQAQAFYGVLRYGAAGADIASAACITAHPVELWCPQHANHWPPYDKAPLCKQNFDANAWRVAKLAGVIANVGTWDSSGLGPNPRSGDGGYQGAYGWSSCTEAFDLANPNAGTIWVQQLAAAEMARRNIYFRESNGNLYSIPTRTTVWQFEGCPWEGDGADLLGKPKQKGIYDEARGAQGAWIGPDGQHHVMSPLAEAYILTGCPLLQELLVAWSVNYLFQEHTFPQARNTYGINTNEPRAHGWTSLTASQCFFGLDDRDFAALLAQGWRNKLNQLYWANALLEFAWGKPCIKVFGHIGLGLTTLTQLRWDDRGETFLNDPNTFDPAGLAIDRFPGAFTLGVSPDQGIMLMWQNSIGAGGNYAAWRLMGGPDGLALARWYASFVVQNAWFLDGAQWRTSNFIGINLQNQLTGHRFSDNPNLYTEWDMWPVSVFLHVENASHPLWAKANAIYNQIFAQLDTGSDTHRWIIPPP